jgi:cell division septal protein FtsQ
MKRRINRQMPRIYGNLQREQRDWRPLLRGFKRFLWVAGTLFALYALFWSPYFRIRTVEVQGVTLSNADFVRAAVPLGGSIWSIPSTQITHQIVAHEPVESVEVLRGIPDGVRLVVHERQPIIAWVAAGTVNLVDAKGEIFLQYPETALPATDTSLGARIAELPRVVDTQNLPVEVGKQIAATEFVLFIQQTLSNFQQYTPEYAWDHAEVGVSFYDVTFIGKDGLRVAMNTLGDSGIQTRNLARLLQQGKAHPNSTVDLRIDRWAYVHE